MVTKKLIELDEESIEKIKTMCPLKHITTPSTLFYHGQTPMAACLVIDGEVSLSKKNKKLKRIVRAGELIGAQELIEHTPSTVNANASANTTVCYLDRSTVNDILHQNNNKLSNLFHELFEASAS